MGLNVSLLYVRVVVENLSTSLVVYHVQHADGNVAVDLIKVYYDCFLIFLCMNSSFDDAN